MVRVERTNTAIEESNDRGTRMDNNYRHHTGCDGCWWILTLLLSVFFGAMLLGLRLGKAA